jgi:hypothetical protein
MSFYHLLRNLSTVDFKHKGRLVKGRFPQQNIVNIFNFFRSIIFNFRAILSHRVSPFIGQRLLASMFTKWRKIHSCTNEILENLAAVLHYRLYACIRRNAQSLCDQHHFSAVRILMSISPTFLVNWCSTVWI